MNALSPSILRPLAALLLGLGLALAGCSTDSSPLSADRTDSSIQPAGQTYLTFSAQAARGLAKTARVLGDGVSASETIGSGGGSIKVENKAGSGREDDVKVALKVPSDALSAPVTIGMTVYGSSLSELVVAFSPSGLVFGQVAALTVFMGDELVDIELEELGVYHVDSSGNVTPAFVLSADEKGHGVKIEVAIPGFSMYGIGNSP